MKNACGLLAIVISFTATSFASTIHVPQDQPTIQAGLNAAANGDFVLVAPGTYTGSGNKNLDFGGRTITLASVNGAAVTIIDCQGSGRGMLFDSGETQSASVYGFTIRNGVAPGTFPNNSGGGIYCNGGSPTIAGCVIENNSAGWGGGGIHCNNASPLILDNIIQNNTAGYAGGIGVVAGNPQIVDNTIVNNRGARFDGGGVYFRNSTSAELDGNYIAGNTCNWNGGGIFLIGSSPLITNNVILDNQASDDGGGIYCQNFSSPRIVNNTLVANSASTGGGLAARLACFPTVANTILWGDSPNEITTQAFSAVTATFCDIEGGFAGQGNINADPLFVTAGDYHLDNISPCIGAGSVVADMPGTDIDGDTRPNPPGSNPDIGADENPN